MGEKLGVDFFQRTQVLFFENGKLVECPLNVFWAKRKAGLIDDETTLIDQTVKNVGDWKQKWIVPFQSSWHAEMWSR
jgi:hypothetical protein